MAQRRKRKTKAAKDHRKLVRVAKKVKQMFQLDHEMTLQPAAAFAAAYVGVATTNTIDNLGTIQTLTSLAQGNGPQLRRTNRITYSRLRGRADIYLPATASFAVGGINHMRAQIIHVKKMPGSVAAHTYPLVRDLLTTSGSPLQATDVEDYCSFNLKNRDANLKVVWDKRFDLLLAPGSTTPCHKGASHKGGECPVQYLGTGIAHRLEWDFKVNNGETTFDGTTDNIATCDENHYLFVVWNEANIANNTAVIQWSLKNDYVSAP